MSLKLNTREVKDILIIDLSGKLTMGEAVAAIATIDRSKSIREPERYC